MKFNLKNRPSSDQCVKDMEYEKWFEGFEKELRERLKYGQKAQKIWTERNDMHTALQWKERNNEIEEILGE